MICWKGPVVSFEIAKCADKRQSNEAYKAVKLMKIIEDINALSCVERAASGLAKVLFRRPVFVYGNEATCGTQCCPEPVRYRPVTAAVIGSPLVLFPDLCRRNTR